LQNVAAFISERDREGKGITNKKPVIVHNKLAPGIYYDWNEQQTTKTLLGRVQYAECYSSKSKARHHGK
jgi:hypothetical protein